MEKILIIGQAPPAPTTIQEVPYSTTMLYDWFKECGISKEQAQELFEFEAVSNIFPGFSEGGHALPPQEAMEKHWQDTLCDKFMRHKKVIVLGRVAEKFINEKFWVKENAITVYIIHPSKRNFSLYVKNKESIIGEIKKVLEFDI